VKKVGKFHLGLYPNAHRLLLELNINKSMLHESMNCTIFVSKSTASHSKKGVTKNGGVEWKKKVGRYAEGGGMER